MTFRFLTYNILDEGYGREPLIFETLQAIQADVILLQELFKPDTIQKLAQSLNMHCFFARGNSSRHLGLLSRFPIIKSYSYHTWPPIHTTVLQATLEISSGESLHIFGVHLIAQPFVAFELWRLWEVKTLLRRIKPYLSEPCLIAGDFNAISPNDLVLIENWPPRLKLMLALQGGRIFRRAIQEILQAGFIDCYRTSHPEMDGFTLPTPVPNGRLDYIFVNQTLQNRLQNCFVVSAPTAVLQASDHFPVAAEFE